jgi:2-phospho-L-lactate guanylyltransferase
MARHVLDTLGRTPGIERVAVVTASDDVAKFAEGLGATVLRQEQDAGTAGAYLAAVEQLAARGVRGVLMISGDIPLVSVQSVTRLIAGAQTAPHVALVADRHGVGTNALLCVPPTAIPVCFGVASFQQHVAQARARGIAFEVVTADDIALDIDEPDDLDCLRRRLRDGVSVANELSSLDLPARRTLEALLNPDAELSIR